MGRKPNQIVCEFFNRGSKLQDSSNRYEHTCKACGEKFPKGRSDSLMNHLVKSCQAISAIDRQRVKVVIRKLPKVAGGEPPRKTPINGRVARGKTVNLPYAARQTVFNGLNVLAEASRQVGASDDKLPTEYSGAVVPGAKTVVVDPALEEAGKRSSETDSHAAFGPSPPPMTHYFPNPAESSPSTPLPTSSVSLLADSTPDARQSSQLSLIAASASQMVPQDVVISLESDTLPEYDQGLTPATQRAALYPRPIAINPNPQGHGFVNSFGATKKPEKHKSRAQFTEERRKEVQLVRKMGACLRCRMLKKTCSPGDPCAQCKSIQSPRVWMECCIRSRLTAQLEAYSAGLHTTLAYHDVNSVKNHVQFEHSPGRIEVTHFVDNPTFITFSVLDGHKPVTPTLDPRLPISGSEGQFPAVQTQDVHLLDGDADELTAKLESYMKKMAPHFFESEPSDFMRPTLALAWDLCQHKKDELLEGVLELWIATRIVVDPELNWKAFLNPTLPPTTIQPLRSTSNEARIPIDEINDPESYTLLCTQLRAAAERCAAKLGKVVLTEVERRLLQKQRNGFFETFLVALVLLNCVERISWLYYTWDNEQYRQRWPLDRRPPYFTSQCDRFGGIVATHLKMRSLGPKSTPSPDTGILRAKEGSEQSVITWFDSINITALQLDERQAAVFDPADSRSLDLKYCSQLFRPGDNVSS